MWIWVSGLLVIGAAVTNNDSMLIASGIFAIAYEIEMLKGEYK